MQFSVVLNEQKWRFHDSAASQARLKPLSCLFCSLGIMLKPATFNLNLDCTISFEIRCIWCEAVCFAIFIRFFATPSYHTMWNNMNLHQQQWGCTICCESVEICTRHAQHWSTRSIKTYSTHPHFILFHETCPSKKKPVSWNNPESKTCEHEIFRMFGFVKHLWNTWRGIVFSTFWQIRSFNVSMFWTMSTVRVPWNMKWLAIFDVGCICFVKNFVSARSETQDFHCSMLTSANRQQKPNNPTRKQVQQQKQTRTKQWINSLHWFHNRAIDGKDVRTPCRGAISERGMTTSIYLKEVVRNTIIQLQTGVKNKALGQRCWNQLTRANGMAKWIARLRC